MDTDSNSIAISADRLEFIVHLEFSSEFEEKKETTACVVQVEWAYAKHVQTRMLRRQDDCAMFAVLLY